MSKNITLIGPMGTGKTTVARALAEKVNMFYIDCDQHLEKLLGITVATIFKNEGEKKFRLRESQVLEKILAGCNQVIATGGGVVLSDKNRNLISENSYCIFINSAIEQLLQRLTNDNKRPLLQNTSEAEIVQLLLDRELLYKEQCDFELVVKHDSVDVICSKLIKHLQQVKLY